MYPRDTNCAKFTHIEIREVRGWRARAMHPVSLTACGVSSVASRSSTRTRNNHTTKHMLMAALRRSVCGQAFAHTRDHQRHGTQLLTARYAVSKNCCPVPRLGPRMTKYCLSTDNIHREERRHENMICTPHAGVQVQARERSAAKARRIPPHYFEVDAVRDALRSCPLLRHARVDGRTHPPVRWDPFVMSQR